MGIVGRSFGVLCAAAVGLGLLPRPAHVRAESEMDQTCRLIEYDVRDCGCATSFLTKHLGQEDASILLNLWVAGTSGTSSSAALSLELYKKYGNTRLAAVSWAYHKVRIEFEDTCKPGETLMMVD